MPVAPPPKLRVPLQPKQLKLYNLCRNSAATWLGYGGSRGGAKSHAARAVVLLMLLENPNTRGCLLRRTYDLVRENHIEPLLAQYPFMREWYRVGDKELLLPNGSVLAFRYAENSGDVDAMIGKQYRWFCVDQAEAFTERELNTMKSCARWPGEGASKFILTFNPGNIGHAFLKRIFVDKQYREGEQKQDYTFLQAYGWDNVEWAQSALKQDAISVDEYYAWTADQRFDYFINRTQYGRELNALPAAMRIGWLLGRMDQFAGQYYDIFSPERHIKRVRPEEWHTRWLGIDWGFAHLATCYWASQLSEQTTGFYREYCASGHSPKALAQEIVDRTPGPERPMVKHIFLSHDAFAQRTEVDTISEQMGQVFRQNGMPYPEMASKDPKGRAALLYDMMGPPIPGTEPVQFRETQIAIDPTCKHLIETIPMVCRDQNDPEKPLKFEGDDPFDGATHALTYRMRTAAVPREVQLMDQAKKIPDLVARWFFLQKHRQDKPKAVITPRIVMPWERQ